MSEEEQVVAIGRAVQAAAASKKKLLTLEAALEHASESFRVAHDALQEILAGGQLGRGHDIYKALASIPDAQQIKDAIREFDEERSRFGVLSERVRHLGGLS
jgi:hypothetical protein